METTSVKKKHGPMYGQAWGLAEEDDLHNESQQKVICTQESGIVGTTLQ